MEKRKPIQQMLLGKMVISLRKTETRSMFITLYQHQFKMDQGPNITPETLKLVQEISGNNLEVIGIGRTSSIEPQQLSN
jgi:hypothetical protein